MPRQQIKRSGHAGMTPIRAAAVTGQTTNAAQVGVTINSNRSRPISAIAVLFSTMRCAHRARGRKAFAPRIDCNIYGQRAHWRTSIHRLMAGSADQYNSCYT